MDSGKKGGVYIFYTLRLHQSTTAAKSTLKATRAPATVTAEDITQLRTLGWSDSDIFDGAAHGARNVATDLLFNAFKLENDF